MRRFLVLVMAFYIGIGVEPAQAQTAVVAYNQAPPVRLVAVMSLSGAYAQIGSQERTALELATNATNRTGGINGRPLVIRYFDDKSQATTAAAITQWIVRNERPLAIIGGSYAATCSTMRGLTEAAHIVQYCLSGVATDDGTFFASFPSPARSFGDLPIAFMKAEHLRSFAVISSDDNTGRVYSEAVLSAAAAEHERVVAAETIRSTDAVAPAVLRVLRHRPAIVYIGANVVNARAILRVFRDQQSQVPVWLVSADATRSAARELANDLPNAAVYSGTTKLAVFEALPENDPQRLLLQRFTSDYARVSGGGSPDVFAVIAADAAEFLVAGLRADHAVGGQTLVQIIERTPRTPALYSYYRFGRGRHNGTELPGVIVRFLPTGTLDYVTTIEDDHVPAEARLSIHIVPQPRTRVAVSRGVILRQASGPAHPGRRS